MLRASDIYGRRPGSVPDKPKVDPKPKDDEPKARTWDAATGQFVEEDLPPEVQEMMRGTKKPRVEAPPEPALPPRMAPHMASGPPAAFAPRPPMAAMQPMRLPPPPPPPPVPVVAMAPVETASPKRLRVLFSGFQKQELNGQYLEQPDQSIQGKVSFWNSRGSYFIYWQRSMERWAICDSGSCQHAKDGSVPGWAYRTNSQHFATTSDGWMEVVGQEWRPAQVVCSVIEGAVSEDMPIQAELSKGSPELTVDQYKALVRQVYSEKNPTKLQDLPSLFSKYEGRMRELFEQVCDKYQASFESLVGGALSSASGNGVKSQNGEGDDTEKLPELAARQYAILVQAVYQKQNPSKLADLAKLLQRYRGVEKDLYLQVCQKYAVHPVKFYKEEGEAMLVEI